MKVRELLEVLKAQDPDAEVCMLNQPNWPMEHAVGWAVARGDLMDAVDDPVTHRSPPLIEGASRSDVVLVEGRWLRGASRAAWTARR